jgi:hypothetical protein
MEAESFTAAPRALGDQQLICRRSDEVDLPGYLVDPDDPASVEFRAHYPTCPDCSRAVERWTRLEAVVRSAARGAGPEHPAEELLLAFQTSPERLRAEDRDSVRLHLEGCPACRNDLAALASFDMAALQREYAGDAARESVPTRHAVREGLFSRLRNWLDSLTPGMPLPALAVALLLVIAIPTALALWWTASERGIPSPPGAEVARSGLEAATDSSAEPVPEPEPQIEAPFAAAPGPSLAQETPSQRASKPDAQAEPRPPAAVEDRAPASPERIAEAAPMPATREVGKPPPAVKEDASSPEALAEAGPPPDAAVAVAPAPAERDVRPPVEAPEEEPDQRVILLAMASLDPPSYSRPPWGVSPARINVQSRHDRADLPVLRALVPDHTALTLRESPVLYWFVSKRTELRLDLTVVDEESIDPVLEVTLDTPVEAGIHATHLSEYGVKLAPGVTYKWYISLSVDHEQSTHDVLSGGVIERIEPSDVLQRELAAADPAERGHILAAKGIWYDALEFFSGWIERSPGNSKLRGQRTALLQQAGLREVAEQEHLPRGDSSAP